MTAPFPAVTKDLFLAHYASTSPDEFDAILRTNGVIMIQDQKHRFAERNHIVRRGARSAADWGDDIRDSSTRFAGLPRYQRREMPTAERNPWVCITKRVPDPKIEDRSLRAAIDEEMKDMTP